MSLSSFAFRARRRLRREVDQRRPDAEIRQLWALQEAYSRPEAPEVLVIGDSAMFWVSPADPDHRTLAQMIGDELGSEIRVHALAGAGYNPRIALVFLEALSQCAYRPKAVVVPTSLLMATSAWLTHPSFGYVRETPALLEILRSGDRTARRLPRSNVGDWEQWDHAPAFSLFGAKRTQGEIRLMINALPHVTAKGAQPFTKWQQVVRLRHMMDLYNAEPLTPESPGVELVRQMGSAVAGAGVASVAYIPPVNGEVLRKVLKEPSIEHVRRNAEALCTAYLSGAGDGHDVVDATLDCPAADFGDPVHLNSTGRRHLAARIAGPVRGRVR